MMFICAAQDVVNSSWPCQVRLKILFSPLNKLACSANQKAAFKICLFFMFSACFRSWNKLEDIFGQKEHQSVLSLFIACLSWHETYPLSPRQMQHQTRSCVGRCASSWTGWRMSVISWQHSSAQKTRHMHFFKESTIFWNSNWMTM